MEIYDCLNLSKRACGRETACGNCKDELIAPEALRRTVSTLTYPKQTEENPISSLIKFFVY